METIPMDPAKTIIGRLGGEAQVAFITGTAYTAPYRWQAVKWRGGTGGLIPQRYHRALLDYARSKGIALTAEEFLPAASGVIPGRRARPNPEFSDMAGQPDSGFDASRRTGTTVTKD
jgi:hypothetical protein